MALGSGSHGSQWLPGAQVAEGPWPAGTKEAPLA